MKSWNFIIFLLQKHCGMARVKLRRIMEYQGLKSSYQEKVYSCHVSFEKYEKRILTHVNNTINNLRHEIKFENHVKNRNNFFIKQNISFLNNTLKYIKYKLYIFFILGKVFFKDF